MQEFREVQRSEVMDGLKSEKQNLKVNTVFDQQPKELLKNRSDMINGWSSGEDDASSRILD